ncbi:MAG: sulfurtransferase complex subunit TusB [Gammaproteobacteria bacterium]|nr:sulfurtransferase complex subunit TusB [Gammaproteobacteria bacterium]
MSLLHTVNKSPFESNTLDACLNLAKSGSTVLLIEDGVYAATSGNAVADKIKNTSGINFCVLGPDAQARGIEGKLAEGIKVVDYEGFVDLVAEHDAVQAWL